MTSPSVTGTAGATERPKALGVRPTLIPDRLKAIAHWVVWRYVWKPPEEKADPRTGEVTVTPGKWDKPPTRARTGTAASSTDPATWSTFDEALAAYRKGGYDGIGFVVHKPGEKCRAHGGGPDACPYADDLVVFDLDKCRDPQTGDLQPWAAGIVADLGSYAEASPSGTGARAVAIGRKPAGRCRKGPFEMYETARYITLTGNRLPDAPAAVEERRDAVNRIHLRMFAAPPPPPRSPADGAKGPAGPPTAFTDDDVVAVLDRAKNAPKFRALMGGDAGGHGGDDSAADAALCCVIAFVTKDAAQIERVFGRSKLADRGKWKNRPDYRVSTIAYALSVVTEQYERRPQASADAANGKAGSNGHNGTGRAHAGAKKAASAEGGEVKGGKTGDDWTEPIPFTAAHDLPPFLSHLLPIVLCEWVTAESMATQTPPDLAGALALAVCAAALAGKVRVVVREGWVEPVNVFTVTALPPGDRKSAVFRDAMGPVVLFEQEEQQRMAPVIAAAASEHRQLEARLKLAEQKSAKSEDPAERQQLGHEAKEMAKELAAHVVPEQPQMFCDDETPESLGRLLAKQGGRMLQASAEGTAFEIVKGRYSESPNFDVYLKGHAGDPLRVGRVGRERDTVDRPALSVALAVQPDVIQGLAEHACLRGRGFLARFLYSLPVSRVGSRTIAPRPVPAVTEAAYREAVLRLWRLEGAVEDGRPAAHLLRFSAEADRVMQDFERWLEPKMAEGEDLSLLAGWAQKLAGAAGRIAGVLHVAGALSEGRPWYTPIGAETVQAAISLARDYFLPHAQAAFAVMGADAKVENTRHVWASIAGRVSESIENSENGGARLSRRDIHQMNRRRFPNVEDLDPVLALLVDRYYLRPVEGTGSPGRGHASPAYDVNPLALAAFVNAPPRTHCTQRTHSDPEPPPSEFSEDSESAPPRSDGEGGGYVAPGYETLANPFDDDVMEATP